MVFAAYNMAKKAGRVIPRTTVVLLGPVVVVFGYPLDLIYNTLLGTVLFLEVPWTENFNPLTWTFTGRIKRWVKDGGLRGRQARWWRDMLNPFDVGHI